MADKYEKLRDQLIAVRRERRLNMADENITITGVLNLMKQLDGEDSFEIQVRDENDGFAEDFKDANSSYWSGVPTFDRISWDKIKKEVDDRRNSMANEGT